MDEIIARMADRLSRIRGFVSSNEFHVDAMANEPPLLEAAVVRLKILLDNNRSIAILLRDFDAAAESLVSLKADVPMKERGPQPDIPIPEPPAPDPGPPPPPDPAPEPAPEPPPEPGPPPPTEPEPEPEPTV